MEHPLLRAGDIGHHRFGIVDDHPSRDPAVEGQRANKGIQHHLLGFAGIGHDKGLATMAQADVCSLHRSLDIAQNNAFFAPVKLEGITGCKMQGNERICRSGTGTLKIADKTLNRRTGPGIPFDTSGS